MKPAVIVLLAVLWGIVGLVVGILVFSGGDVPSYSSFLNNSVFLTSDCAVIFDSSVEFKRNMPDQITSPEQTKLIFEQIEEHSNDFMKNDCVFTVDEWKDDVKNKVDFADVDWDMLRAITMEAQMKK